MKYQVLPFRWFQTTFEVCLLPLENFQLLAEMYISHNLCRGLQTSTEVYKYLWWLYNLIIYIDALQSWYFCKPLWGCAELYQPHRGVQTLYNMQAFTYLYGSISRPLNICISPTIAVEVYAPLEFWRPIQRFVYLLQPAHSFWIIYSVWIYMTV